MQRRMQIFVAINAVLAHIMRVAERAFMYNYTSKRSKSFLNMRCANKFAIYYSIGVVSVRELQSQKLRCQFAGVEEEQNIK